VVEAAEAAVLHDTTGRCGVHADLLIVDRRRAAGASETARRRGPNFVNNSQWRERRGTSVVKGKAAAQGAFVRTPVFKSLDFSVYV
jgi:hypothetical protein